jgi:hypothetical protein
MAKPRSCWIALALPFLVMGAAKAQPPQSPDPALQLIRGGGTPAVFPGHQQRPRPINSCPRLVKAGSGDVEPLAIAPADVAAKNRLGCLSPADAIYGADGCPLRLCRADQGVVPLPPHTQETGNSN